MTDNLVKLEQEALRLKNKGDFQTAIETYKKIIRINPNYEFGICFYNLACCQEEIGNFSEAKKNYLKAIAYNMEDDIRLGGYASFLYLHGGSQEAFNAYLDLLKLDKKYLRKVDDLMKILITLGNKLGLTEQEVLNKVDKI